jgi:hypothetical protein
LQKIKVRTTPFSQYFLGVDFFKGAWEIETSELKALFRAQLEA